MGLLSAKLVIIFISVLTLSVTGAFFAYQNIKAPLPPISPLSSFPIPSASPSSPTPSPSPSPSLNPDGGVGTSAQTSPVPISISSPNPGLDLALTSSPEPSPCPDATIILGKEGSGSELEDLQKMTEFSERTGCKLEENLQLPAYAPDSNAVKREKLSHLNWCVPIDNQGPKIGFYSGEPQICDGPVDPLVQWFRDCVTGKKPTGDYAKTMEAVDQCVNEISI